MYRRTLLMMLIALLGAAAIALWLKNSVPSDGKAEGDAPALQVLAAVADLRPGSFVQPGKDINWIPLAKDQKTDGLILSDSAKIENYAGAVVRVALPAGKPIAKDALVRSSEGGFLSAVMKPGMRAVSIAVNPTSGNAGFTLPGDKVDLIVTHEVSVKKDSGADKVLASETFVRNARVLAVDQSIDNPERQIKVASTVTLEVTPKQAEMVQVAIRLGQISLSLRSLGPNENGVDDSDTSPETLTRDSDVSQLLNGRGGDTPKKVQVIRGNESEQKEFLK